MTNCCWPLLTVFMLLPSIRGAVAADTGNPFVDDVVFDNTVTPAGMVPGSGPSADEARAVFAASFHELRSTGILDRALTVGDRAPDFELPTANGLSVRLAELRAVGPVVLVYYRGNWCPFCTRQLQGLQRVLNDVHALDAQLVAVSPEAASQGLETQRQNELAYPTLADANNAVAREFGIAYRVSDEAARLYSPLVDLPAHNGDAGRELPLAATYVIDSTGVIRYAFVSVDFTERADPAEILSVLRRLKNAAPASRLSQPLARR